MKNPPQPYLRERARAILRVANNEPIYQIAVSLRLRIHRNPISVWVRLYEKERLEGLRIKTGRGRKAAFPREVIEWLKGVSKAGVVQILKRLGFSRKQAIALIRSPDPEYQTRWQALLTIHEQIAEQNGEEVLLYLDGLTYYRRPSKAPAYWKCGHTQPCAMEAPRANTQTRIVAALNHSTGQVDYLQRSKIGRATLVAFYGQLRKGYPQAKTIYVVQDNWAQS